MAATNDTLFVAGKKHVMAISLITHQIIWKYESNPYALFIGSNKLFMLSQNVVSQTFLTAIALN